MPSKEPQVLSLEAFAVLADAPEGRGGQVKKINWDAVLEQIKIRPMSNATTFKMICGDKKSYMFSEDADDPNEGTIWTKLKQWTANNIIAKKVDAQGNIFYGPIALPAKAAKKVAKGKGKGGPATG